jgi:hypothetical protein
VLERQRAMHGRLRGIGPLAHGSSESRNMSAIADWKQQQRKRRRRPRPKPPWRKGMDNDGLRPGPRGRARPVVAHARPTLRQKPKRDILTLL